MALSILVCIKAVPDAVASAALTIQGGWIDETAVAWAINRYDACALEAALAIKDAYPGVRVDVLSAGPDRVRAVIRRAMAMGADAGVHLVMEAAGRPAPAPVAGAIAHYAGAQGHDLILAGAVSEDLMQGITGPLIAAALDWPCAAAAVRIEVDLPDRSVTAACEMEGGMAETFRVSMPAVVTVLSSGNQPRYPSLSNTLRSRRASLARVVPLPQATGHLPPQPATVALAYPRRLSACRMIEGTPGDKADALLRIFGDRGWLK